MDRPHHVPLNPSALRMRSRRGPSDKLGVSLGVESAPKTYLLSGRVVATADEVKYSPTQTHRRRIPNASKNSQRSVFDVA